MCAFFSGCVVFDRCEGPPKNSFLLLRLPSIERGNGGVMALGGGGGQDMEEGAKIHELFEIS